MLVTADGGIKLADFGVAAQLQSSIAKRSTVIGTPHWMAPEMLDQMEQYDNKVDIWGIGITAIELAQLKPPFFEMETMPAMRRITNGLPAKLEPETAATLEFHAFLRAVLVKHADARPTAGQLLEHKWVTSAKGAPLAKLVGEQEKALKEEALAQAGGGGGGAAMGVEDGGGSDSEGGQTLPLDQGGGGSDSEGGQTLPLD